MKARKNPIVVDVRGPLTEAEFVTTAHGRVLAQVGSYILTDPRTKDTWPITAELFAATYRIVE